MNRLRQNVLSLFTLQGVNYLLPLVTIPYLVRVLGPEHFGRIAFAQAFIQYFFVVADYGFNLSATRAVAIVRDDPSRLSRLISAVTVVKIGLTVGGLALVYASVMLIPAFERDVMLYLAAYLAVLGNVLFPIWLFQGLERMREMTILAVAARLLAVFLIFGFVHGPDDYRLAAGLQAGAPILAGALSVLVLRQILHVRLGWPGLASVRAVLGDGVHAFMSSAAISLYTTTTTFVLGLFAPPAAVGYFAAAQKVVTAVTGLISPVSQAVYPHLSALVSTSRDATIALIGRLLRFQALATLGLSILLYVFSDQITAIVLGAAFEPSSVLLRVMAAVPFLIGLSNIFGIQVMFVFSLDRLVTRVVAVCGVLNIALLALLVPQLREVGAAIAIVAIEALVTALMAVTLARTGHLRPILAAARLRIDARDVATWWDRLQAARREW